MLTCRCSSNIVDVEIVYVNMIELNESYYPYRYSSLCGRSKLSLAILEVVPRHMLISLIAYFNLRLLVHYKI